MIPSGGDFEVVFCPPGRSTNILASKAAQLTQLSQTGQVSEGPSPNVVNKALVPDSVQAEAFSSLHARHATSIAAVFQKNMAVLPAQEDSANTFRFFVA